MRVRHALGPRSASRHTFRNGRPDIAVGFAFGFHGVTLADTHDDVVGVPGTVEKHDVIATYSILGVDGLALARIAIGSLTATDDCAGDASPTPPRVACPGAVAVSRVVVLGFVLGDLAPLVVVKAIE